MKLSELIRRAGASIMAHGDMEVLIESQDESGCKKATAEQCLNQPGHPWFFFIYTDNSKTE